ncbi:hypothetical protein PQR34_45070 [Paraburkholderia sediminicola]|uniref:DUF7706 family protein n=1 Tax=Paraburkholderia sediminicola TaxID=458836 RepID=UPI0038BA2D5F
MFVMTVSREADKLQGYAELDDGETRALAQLVKRIGWSEMRGNAIDDDEAALMRRAIEKLQSALAGAGVAPR